MSATPELGERLAADGLLAAVLAAVDGPVVVTDAGGRVTSVGGLRRAMLARPEHELVGATFDSLFVGAAPCPDDGGTPVEAQVAGADGGTVTVSVRWSDLGHGGRVWVLTDLTDVKRLEADLRHSQQLESIGQLAAGVAHEISTPVQFIGDSALFLGDVIEDLVRLVEQYRLLRADCDGDRWYARRCGELTSLEDEIDVDATVQEALAAVTRTSLGVQRVGRIVGALKRFAHPGGQAMAPVDLAELVETSLVVSHHEYRFVADVVTELAVLPPVAGVASELSQVVLNLVVNAAHAIAQRPDGGRGTITVRLWRDGDFAALSVSDDGVGIPADIRDRVFEPFFTTKAAGQGTGQGLAIVRSVVVDGHDGTVDIDSRPGLGTTVTVRLPMGGLR